MKDNKSGYRSPEREPNKIEKLNLSNTDLVAEFYGLSSPDYVTKRLFGEVQKKINEIIEIINKDNL